MPYARKKKSYPKKRTYRRAKTSGWMGVAKKALQTANFVRSLVNAETKYSELSNNGYTTDYNGAIANLFVPAQGVQETQREGNSVKLKNLTLRGQFARNGSDQVVRLIIYRDNENTTTGTNDVLQNFGLNISVFANKNQDLKFSTKILYDKKFIIDSNNPLKLFNIGLKLGFHVHFVGTSTTISKNAVKMLIISQTAANGPILSYDSYITYMDN